VQYHWDNQNRVLSWQPRLIGTALVTIGVAVWVSVAMKPFAAPASVVFVLGTGVFIGLLSLWVAVMCYVFLRQTPLKSIAVEPASGTLVVEYRSRSACVPLSQVGSITLSRGLVYLSVRHPKFGSVFGRQFVFALYDQDLRSFVTSMKSVGLDVTREWGGPIPSDIDYPG
jgi:hypothetical protein